ncbi:MAG: CopG family transcriptional regulator [Gemmatimonadota bacterium]
MMRSQVQFTEDQHRALKRWADHLGISISEAVRRCVAERLAREDAAPTRADRVREAETVIGKYASGRSDVAERHDDYLPDAFHE